MGDYIDFGGICIWYDEQGAGPPLVLADRSSGSAGSGAACGARFHLLFCDVEPVTMNALFWSADDQQSLRRDSLFDDVMSEPAPISLDVDASDAGDLLNELTRLAND